MIVRTPVYGSSARLYKNCAAPSQAHGIWCSRTRKMESQVKSSGLPNYVLMFLESGTDLNARILEIVDL